MKIIHSQIFIDWVKKKDVLDQFKINGILNIEKNDSTQLFFVSGHFYEGVDFLDEGARNILPPRRIHFALI